MGPTAVLEHKIMARYDLAKFFSREGMNDRAFEQWRAGHALLRKIQPFSRETAKAYNDAAIAAFTPQRYASGPRAENADPAPVFIVGMPRSGTTLAEQILAAHPQAHGAGERSALGRLAWRLGGGETPEAIRPHRGARSGDARCRSRGLSQGFACPRAEQNPRRRQDAGQLFARLADRAVVPESQDHPLPARSARHRSVHLHLPLSRRAWLCPRAPGSRLGHRRAGQADAPLEGCAAHADSGLAGSTTG